MKWVNCNRKNGPQIVYVEDSAIFRLYWENSAKLMGVALLLCESPSEFLKVFQFCKKADSFYFDCAFGEDHAAGLKLAKYVKPQVSGKVYLATSYPKENFIKEIENGEIDGVIGKIPPFSVGMKKSGEE